MTKDYWGRISRENDKSFEEMLDQTYMEHHYHPTYIPTFNVSKVDQARQAELDAQAAQLAKQGKGEYWPNGLPGPVSSETFVSGSGVSRSGSSGCVKFAAAVFVITMIIMVTFAIAANTGGL